MSATLERTPERTIEQRMDALQTANKVRMDRAVLKRELKEGRELAVRIIGRPPEYAESMKVIDLLLAVPWLGPMKAGRVMRRCDVSPAKTLGGITTRQRRALIVALNGREWNVVAPRYEFE